MAIQMELFQSPWAVKTRTTVQAIWRNPWFGWLMIVVFSIWYAWWSYHVPSPAKAATVLGFIAAVMALRSEPEGFEKMFWTIVLFAFLFMELKAIDHREWTDDQQHKLDRASEAREFTNIGIGIENVTRQSERQFRETVEEQSRNFDALMGREKRSIDAITGGGSYVVVFPDFAVPASPGVFRFIVTGCDKCQSSIPNPLIYFNDDFVKHNDLGKLIFEKNVSLDPSYSIELEMPTITPSRKGVSAYRFITLARNKPTSEMLYVRYNESTNLWECSWAISRQEKRPHRNQKTGLAEGEILKMLERSPWHPYFMTPIDPKKTIVIR